MSRCKPPKHLPRCSPRRPRCNWNRRKGGKQKKCECGVYHFPHRMGSGLCGYPEKVWEELDKVVYR